LIHRQRGAETERRQGGDRLGAERPAERLKQHGWIGSLRRRRIETRHHRLERAGLQPALTPVADHLRAQPGLADVGARARDEKRRHPPRLC